MDIAALSMSLSQMKLQQEASISVMKMAMDTQSGGLEKLMGSSLESLEASQRMMEQSVNPNLGSNLDIKL
ncbi:hypothetical protein GGQ84_000550 [Desulfitispora alkaliphila]|uniref:YjfB family protein n=1 Tax=Desulfitispora alkaliphila TaxID=622674 RepID=UPI003D1CEB9D